MFNNMWRKLYEWIFPDTCVCCKKESGLFCKRCLSTFVVAREQVCPVCRSSSERGAVCGICKSSTNLSFLLLGSEYTRGSIVSLFIQTLKYKGMSRVITLFPTDVIHIYKEALSTSSYFFVPVPLHSRRYRERGFNQAEVFARYLHRYCDIPVHTILQRIVYTAPQATLSRTLRLQNLKDAFAPAAYGALPQGIPVLVDDVATTLSTLESCGDALRKMGYQQIGALAIARGK